MLDHDGGFLSGGVRAGDGGHIDEGMVHAWLDGQLSGDEAARIAAHVEACAACSAVVADARGIIAAATRILNTLDGVPARVLPRATRRIQRWHVRVAAAVIVVALGTTLVLRGPGASLRSAYEARAVPATHVPEAPTAQQAPSAPSPSVGGTTRAAGPMVRPAPTQKRAPESSPSNASQASALAAKARREPSVLVQASPPPDAESRAAARAQSVVSDQALAGAPSADSLGVPAPTIENALQGKVPPLAAAPSAPISGAGDRVANARTAAAARMGATANTAVRQITGRVVEADEGKPIPAASIVVSGTTVGSNTSDSGSFALAVPPGAKVLTARRIGYEAETVPLTPGATDYTIPMKKDVLRLEAQVVTGAATTTSSQNAAAAVAVVGESSALAPLGASRCRNRVVRLPGPNAVVSDSMSVRMTEIPSVDATHPGLVVRPVPDTVGAEFGRWQPIGTDSALIALTRPAGTMPRRVACGDR